MREYPTWLNDAFVGLHYDLHANVDDTNLGAELTHEHLREQLEKVRPDFVQCDCKGHPGYTSYPTKVGSPSPGIVRDALRIHRDVTAEMGLPLLVHYSGIWDARAIELHPDWAAVNYDGTAIHTIPDSPACVCILGPYVEELMIPQVHEIIDEYDIDGIWVDGDNWAVRDCYCPRCRVEFAKRTGIIETPVKRDDHGWLNWRMFRQDIFVEYVTKYANAIHARKPQCAVCSNWMYSMRQSGTVEAPVDFLSGDFMSSFGCERAEMEGRYIDGHGMPWNLMAWTFCKPDDRLPYQFKTATHLKQESAEVLSCGGGVFMYNQPQRSGWLTGWHQDILTDVVKFCRERQQFCQHTESVPEAVVLQGDSHSLSNNPEVFCMGESFYRAEGALHALIENHYHVDILDEPRLIERINSYNLVVIGEQNPISSLMAEALEEYARSGGVVLMTGHHLANAHGRLLGVEATGDLRNTPWHVEVDGEVASLQGPWQPVRLVDATANENIMVEQQPGKDETEYPAVTIRQIGKGKIAAIHGDAMLAYYLSHHPRLRCFIANILNRLDISRKVRISGPASIEVTLRKQNSRMMVNLVNRAVNPTLTPRFHIVEEVPQTGPVEVEVRIDKEPSRVTLEPEKRTVKWTYDNGWLKAKVDSVHIHEILVIER